MKKPKRLYLCIVCALALGAACAPSPPMVETPIPMSPTAQVAASPADVPTDDVPSATLAPATTETIPTVAHLMTPADAVPVPRKMVDDVESFGTGPEGRAPYGDSYKLNRFERPFLQDMTYVPALDIHRFGLSEDQDWYYISIQLIGDDPNDPAEIHYGAELDANADGFGDYILWARPPYTQEWDTSTVQVFSDSNVDSAGLSPTASDAVLDSDGYETLVFDGGAQDNSDPDLAWVRMSGERAGLIQFAFKKTLTGPAFLLGAVADAGLRDVTKFDYADHIAQAEAGSPVRNDRNYPLGTLYAVDNTCWEAYGLRTTGYEPKLCQPILQPVNTPSSSCDPPPDCGGGPYNPDTCECE